MNVTLLAHTPNPEQLIERCGRVCYKSENAIKYGTTERFIRMLLKRGHDSVLEHACATFLVSGISRSCSHQLVRHRIGCSFSQVSQRYVDHCDFNYVVPDSIQDNEQAKTEYHRAMSMIGKAYEKIRWEKIPPEDARFLLPNACTTEIAVTMNFRALRHFLKLRLDKHAQWEIRSLAEKMLSLVYEVAPNVFIDLKDGMKDA